MATQLLQRLSKNTVETPVQAQTVAEPEVNPVEAAVRTFEAEQTALTELMAEHHGVLDQFDAMANAYNDALSAAKLAIKQYEGDLGKCYKGPFSTRKGSTTVTFDRTKLPEEILGLPGVLVIDNGALKGLEENPLITPEWRALITAAKTTTTAGPSIVGPKEVSLAIGGKK